MSACVGRPWWSAMLLLLFSVAGPRGGARGARLRFGPPLNADPGAGEAFSIPHAEFDPEPGVECAYPPCRPLRHDVQVRLRHDQQLKHQEQKLKDGGLYEQPSEQTEYPPRLNVVAGGGDCRICNQLLLGAGLNPSNLNHMRHAISRWLSTADKIIHAKPKDAFFKQHAIHIVECFHAFDRLTCTVDEPNDA